MASRGVNKVILVGNLGNDPDVRYMQSGEQVVNLSLATSETWNDKFSGEPREKTEWHRIVAFGKLAEIIAQYCRKGSKLYIEGKLQTRKWQDQNGQDRYSTEIIANEMQMLDSRNDNGGEWQQGGRANNYAPANNRRQGNQRNGGYEGQGQQGGAAYGNPPPQGQQNPQQPMQPKAPQSMGPDDSFDDADEDIPF